MKRKSLEESGEEEEQEKETGKEEGAGKEESTGKQKASKKDEVLHYCFCFLLRCWASSARRCAPLH